MSFVPDAVLRKTIDVIYMKYDRNNSGTLDSSELVNCFNQLLGMVGHSSTVNGFIMKAIVKKMDKDGDGQINKMQFLQMFRIFESQGGSLMGGHKSMQSPQQFGNNQGGFDQGYNQGGYNQGGYNQGGFNQGGFNQGGNNQGGYNQGGYNQGGYNQGGW